MKIIITIIAILILNSCSIYKQVDDTEHLWRGDNGIEFYE